MSNTLIIIPVRMDSKRFPGKPLVKIRNKTMLEHVIDRAKESKVGKVIVACCDKEITELLDNIKTDYIMTKKNLESGTDRVSEAFKRIKNKKKYDFIINLQGDIPFINHKYILKLKELIKQSPPCIASLVSEIKEKRKINDPNVVKAVLSKYEKNSYRAIYFSRSPVPYNSEKYYEHIGIYAYSRNSLQKFVNFEKSLLEKNESLEQLRALDNHMKILVGKVKESPISIDTRENLISLNKKER